MDIAACYRLLELNSSASLAEVKASYRRLARQYHPDVHPGDRQAQDKFIQLTEAYQILLRVAKPSAAENVPSQFKPASVDDQHQTQQVRVSVQHPTVDEEMPPEQSYAPDKTPIRITRKAPGFQTSQPLSPLDQQLKDNSYQQLQELLKYQRFPRAIALVEGLAQRLPQDPEVRQWQAIAYQRWGRYLIGEKQQDKARAYLKKALRTDPHNKSLWAEVERDFRRLEKIF